MIADPNRKDKFLALVSFGDLAQLLGLTSAGLRHFCHAKPYQQFALSKKIGGYRIISAPKGPLKTIQRRLALILLDVYGGRAPVHGFARGKSIKTNAARHVGRKYVFNIDLVNFFPSIHYGRVRGLFVSKPYSLPLTIAEALVHLTCHLGSLPQGAPTSPILSNLICGGLNAKLKELARRHKCRYTRYADDITFSCDGDTFPLDIAALSGTDWFAGAALEAAITKEGFSVNASKTTMQVAGSRQMVTGLVVNQKVNVTRLYSQSVRGMIGSLEYKGLQQAEADYHAKYVTKQSVVKEKKFIDVLIGKVNYIGFVKGWDSSAYLALSARLQRLGIVRKQPVSITQSASGSALYETVWLVEAGISEDYAVQQSSGFSWGQHGIVTAAHAVGEYDDVSGAWQKYEYVQVRQPHLNNGAVFKAKILEAHPHSDLALVEYPFMPLVSLQRGSGNALAQRDAIRILGFPHYHDGDSCTDQDFVINASRVYSGVHHRVVVGSIIKGNSGGPVLNQQNQVVGIALKGQQIPAHFSDKDSLSSLPFLKH